MNQITVVQKKIMAWTPEERYKTHLGVVIGVCVIAFNIATGILSSQPMGTDCGLAEVGLATWILGVPHSVLAVLASAKANGSLLLLDFCYTTLILILAFVNWIKDIKCANYETDNDKDVAAIRATGTTLTILNTIFLFLLAIRIWLVLRTCTCEDCECDCDDDVSPSHSVQYRPDPPQIAVIPADPPLPVTREQVVASSSKLEFMGIETEDGLAIVAVIRQTELTMTGEGEEATLGVRQHTGVIVG